MSKSPRFTFRSFLVVTIALVVSPIVWATQTIIPGLRVDEAVRAALESRGFADVVIEIENDPPMPFARSRPANTDEGRAKARAIASLLSRSGAREVYDTGVGLVLARLTPGSLARIQAQQQLKAVRMRQPRIGAMSGALDAVGIQDAGIPIDPDFTAGGAGEEIVIIDGGFDLQHPAFVGATINQYCSCGTEGPGNGCCPDGTHWQEGIGQNGVGSAQAPALPSNATFANYHGTLVAATVISQGLGGWPKGAAPRVTINLINVQGNQWIPSAIAPTTYFFDYNAAGVHQALARIAQWRQAGRRIRAVSMSFRSVGSTSAGNLCENKPRFCEPYESSVIGPPPNFEPTACPSLIPIDPETPAYVQRVDALINQGVMVFAAAGNAATTTRGPDEGEINHPLPVPACVTGVVPVSATRHPVSGLPQVPRNQPFGEGCRPSWAYLPIPQSRSLWCESTVDPLRGVAVPGLMTLPATRVTAGQPGTLERTSVWAPGTSFAAPIAAACVALIAKDLSSHGIAWNVGAVLTQMSNSAFIAGRPHPTDSSAAQYRPLVNCYETLARLRQAPASTSIQFRQESQSGTFFNPSTPGQGLIIDVSPSTNLIFAALYTYAPDPILNGGGLRWYPIQIPIGAAFTKDSMIAPIAAYSTNFLNPRFGVPLQPCPTGNCPINLLEQATGTLKFTSCNDIELKLDPSPSSEIPALSNNTILLRRLGAPGTCQENSQLISQAENTKAAKCSTAFNSGLTGTWQQAKVSGANWIPDPEHAGRGWLIEVNSGQSSTGCTDPFIFVGWYDYRGLGDSLEGKQRWITLQGFQSISQSPTRLFQGSAYATYGGAYGLPMPNPTTPPAIGSALIEYLDCNRAILTYNFQGSPPISGYAGIVGTSGAIQLVRVIPKVNCQF